MIAKRFQEEHGLPAPSLIDSVADRRLDNIRGDIEIQISICVAQLDIAATFLMVRQDKEAIKTLGDARERMRAALAQAARLQQALEDAGILAEAASEWRPQAERRRA